MPKIATYDQLKPARSQSGVESLLKKAYSPEDKTVFLSHATIDNDVLPGVLSILVEHGGRVYINNDDPSLVESDCVVIAKDNACATLSSVSVFSYLFLSLSCLDLPE